MIFILNFVLIFYFESVKIIFREPTSTMAFPKVRMTIFFHPAEMLSSWLLSRSDIFESHTPRQHSLPQISYRIYAHRRLFPTSKCLPYRTALIVCQYKISVLQFKCHIVFYKIIRQLPFHKIGMFFRSPLGFNIFLDKSFPPQAAKIITITNPNIKFFFITLPLLSDLFFYLFQKTDRALNKANIAASTNKLLNKLCRVTMSTFDYKSWIFILSISFFDFIRSNSFCFFILFF